MLNKYGNGTIAHSNENWCVSNTGTPYKIYIRYGQMPFDIVETITYDEAIKRVNAMIPLVTYSEMTHSVVNAIYECINEYRHTP